MYSYHVEGEEQATKAEGKPYKHRKAKGTSKNIVKQSIKHEDYIA